MIHTNEPGRTHYKIRNWLVIHRLSENCSVVYKLMVSTKMWMQKTDVEYVLRIKILIPLIMAVSETIKTV